MSEFGWPQYTMLGLLLLATTYIGVTWVRDPKLSTSRVAVQVSILTVEVMLFAGLLRAGGFW